MKVTILEKNDIDALVSLEDGRILSVPLNKLSQSSAGNTFYIPNSNLICSKNTSDPTSINNLIDFF